MVGQNEAAYVCWIWLHRTVLGYAHVFFLDDPYHLSLATATPVAADANNNTQKAETERQLQPPKLDDSADAAVAAFTFRFASFMSYDEYIRVCYSSHRPIVDLICFFCGHLFGWKTPWIAHSADRLYKNLKMYKRIYSYPSQSLMDDERNEQNKMFMAQHNRHNLLTDAIVVSTKNDGYWLGNISSGNWYKLGFEQPYLKNLHNAMSRGSMCMELFPRSDRLYFSGGLVCGMAISTVVELDLDSMKLGILSEMQSPRAYLSMHFYPDSIAFVGGTNCWQHVYKTVEMYDLLERRWHKWPSLKYPRYGHGGVTINERYMFITGGCNRFYSVMNCELFDRKEGKWSTYSSMLQPVQNANVVKYKHDLFVVGSRSRECQIFSLEKKQWRFGPKLNHCSSKKGRKFCTIDYRLIAMDKDDISTYEIYDENSNRWYATDIRNHPVSKLYPKPFMHSSNIFDWFHLGRKYW